jgi:hypothetical protein
VSLRVVYLSSFVACQALPLYLDCSQFAAFQNGLGGMQRISH